ncbi:hypothetical protein QBC37DRAFT_136616 [Rhypophila decipiens]|uniref:NACHT domain-containing protein n=1 Tax=Rhypophila decipiens TaxID=261697 RepID=A0AAN7BDN1_9PEZI|nr:hypothetical protein QBC37DRAFT_136616 [Rhypophila decipiens]
MSGLETPVALGLACSVFQVISFARDVCTIGRAICEKGEPGDSAASLTNSMSNLTAIIEDIKTAVGSASPSMSPTDKRMFGIAQDCNKAALELKAEIDKYSGAASSAQGSKLRSTWVAVKSVVRSRAKLVDKLEKRLQTHQNTLETELLVKICSKADAARLCQQDEFKKLDGTLRDFVKRFSDGETRMAALLVQHSESVKDHVTEETAAVKVHVTEETAAVKDHVTNGTATVTAAISDSALDSKKAVQEVHSTMRHSNIRADMKRRRKKLIKSLKYPTMNGRRNLIEDPHAETFEWIFTGRPLPNADAYSDSDLYEQFDDGVDDEVDDDGQEFDYQYDDGFFLMKDASSRMEEASSRLSAWLRDPAQQLFWITGKPGSGKSTLVKFLVDDPRTRDGLTSYECGARDVVILSHFIWSAGQAMERSVRGMLCSLIYQLIDENGPMSDRVLERFPQTKAKDSCSDWSEKELRNVLHFLLGDSRKAFCFFIDGLDEISETDGQPKLIELIREMRAGSNMKMCVSSRPEPILKKHLGVFPMIRMQDLTEADIFKFTSSLLRRRLLDNSIDLNTSEYQTLVDDVCWKAEGVFLWVVLAVRNLLVGIEKGDEMEQLQRRLDLMPSELKDLYRAMWIRLGAEKQIYQEDAASYFNLILLINDTSSFMTRASKIFSTSLQLLLATDSKLADRALLTTPEPLPSDDELRTLANKMAHRVETSCLGLLDIKTSDTHPNEMKLEFIHGSAKEFLETDAEGRALLELDNSTKQERVFRMVKARLAMSFLVYLGNSRFEGFYTPDEASEFISKIVRLWEMNHISETQKLQLALLSRPLFKPYLRLCTGVPFEGPSPYYADLLGAAAHTGFLSFLEQAMRTEPCWGVTAGPVSVPYMSYLVAMALEGLAQSSKWDDGVKTVRWLLKHDVNPNFPTRPYDYGSAWKLPISPLKAAVSFLVKQGLPLDQYAPVVDILSCMLQAGGDLSSPLILVVERNWWDDRPKLQLEIMRSGVPYLRVYIEVETALVIELFVRKYVRHNATNAASVKQLLAMLESSPRSYLPVKRIAVANNFSVEEDRPLGHPSGVDHEKSFWATSDPACLSRIQEHLKGDLESNCPSEPHDGSDCEDYPANLFEISTSCIHHMVKEVTETGKQTSWADVWADWFSKDIVWRKRDPRLGIPEAWPS